MSNVLPMLIHRIASDSQFRDALRADPHATAAASGYVLTDEDWMALGAVLHEDAQQADTPLWQVGRFNLSDPLFEWISAFELPRTSFGTLA